MSKPFRNTFFNKYFDYDAACDAGYINLPNKDRKVAKTEQVDACLLVDRNANGDIIGVEILGVAQLMTQQGFQNETKLVKS